MVKMEFYISSFKFLILFIPVLKKIEQIYVEKVFTLFGVLQKLFRSLVEASQSGINFLYPNFLF